MGNNKKMTILAASLVLSVALSVTVTDSVRGREEGRTGTLWTQLAENAMKTFGGQDQASVRERSVLPTRPQEKEGEPAGRDSVTGRETEGTAPSGQVRREEEAAPKEPLTPQNPGGTEEAMPEARLPEVNPPKTMPSSELPEEDGSPVPALQGEGMEEAIESDPSPESPAEEAKDTSDQEGKPASAEAGAENASIRRGERAELRKETILQLTAIAENGTITMQYNHAEELADGQGIAFGLMGFRTGTREGNALVRHYAALNRDSRLAAYLPALEAMERMPRAERKGKAEDHLQGLEGFIEEVRNNTDPLFRQAQLEMLDRLYWTPSARLLHHIGGKHPLTMAFLYDMMMSHGEEGTMKFLSKADYALGGTPAQGISEEAYLRKLMDLRETYLSQTGNASADRVAAFREVLDTGNETLETPFSFTVSGATFRIDGKLP